MMNTQNTLFKLFTVNLLFLSFWGCTQAPVRLKPAVSSDDLMVHITNLASDELAGRKPGTQGDRDATAYIERTLLQAGFTKEEITRQPFEITVDVKAGPDNSLRLGDYQARPLVDFTPLSFSSSGKLNAAVVFTGYGYAFSSDSLSRDDYAGADVGGQWAMVLRGDPDPDNPDSPYLPYSSLRNKIYTARDQGAAGVLFVSGPQFDPDDDLIDLGIVKGSRSVGLPVIHIKRQLANRILSENGAVIGELEKQLNAGESMAPIPIEASLTVVTDLEITTAWTDNILATIPGSDPQLRDNYVVIGAHYDHLGMGGPGSGSRRPDTMAVHNGADDNASGVAAVLEIAHQLRNSSVKPKRSLLLAFFGAEEMGLLGSKHFIAESTIDIDKITAMLNLDMLGNYQPDSTTLNIGGTGTAVGLADIINQVAEANGITTSLSPEGYGPSDHAAFYTSDIPVLFFFTGAHDRYHTPADDARFINYQGEEQVVRMITDLTSRLANRSEKLVFQEAGPKTRSTYRRRFKVTLGIMPDHTALDVPGLRVDIPIPGRPAALAGMQKGDVIIAMDGKSVGDIYEYMHRLSEFKVGQRISVEVLRDGQKHILIVEL